MRPVQTQVESRAMPRALIIGAGPEALIGIEPLLGTNRFRVNFLDKHDTPYSAVRLLRPDDRRPQDCEPIAKMYVSARGGSIRRLIGSAHRHVIAMRPLRFVS